MFPECYLLCEAKIPTNNTSGHWSGLVLRSFNGIYYHYLTYISFEQTNVNAIG